MTYNENLGLIDVIFKGPIELNDIFVFIENIGKSKFLYPECKILTDATEANYQFKMDDLALISEALAIHTTKFTSLKLAFIHINPHDTAISVLFEEEYEAENYFHKTFSTYKSGLEWLLAN